MATDSFLGFGDGDAVAVTGGASGIGRSLALTAARHGLRVAVWDVDGSGARACADEIAGAGGTAIARSVDAADRADVAEAWAHAVESLGPVSGLAAVGGPPSFGERPFLDGVTNAVDCMRVPTESWLEAVDLQERSAVYLSSVQGPRYGAGVPWYTVAKGAIDAYMRSIAAMRPGGIRANAILPDLTLTPRTEPHLASTGGERWPENPMGRVGSAQDVANAALFLLSPAARYVNGQSLEVDGGMSLRSAGWFRLNRPSP